MSLSEIDVCIANNQETASVLQRFTKKNPVLIQPVTYFNDSQFADFESVYRARQDLRSPRDPASLRIFMGGTLEARKGMSLALLGVAQARQNGLACEFIIAGGGPEQQSLVSLAEKLGISDVVQFHPGFKGKEYLEELGRADIYLMPSLRETLSITMVEAILCGCYPITADATATGDLLRHHEIGTRIKVTNPDVMTKEIADSLEDFSRHKEESSAQLAGARPGLIKSFSQQAYIETIEQAYATAINSKATLQATS